MNLENEIYYGSKNSFDSTCYFEWMNAIKHDFKRFTKYILCGRCPMLEEKLDYIGKLIVKSYDFGESEENYSQFRMTRDYLVFDYPLLDENGLYYFNVVIISRDYKTFFFINTYDCYTHVVDAFKVNHVSVSHNNFVIKNLYDYFDEDSRNQFLDHIKKMALTSNES